MTMQQGWILLHRQLFNSEWYFAEKFTRMQAWIDLLLLAEFEEKIIYVRGQKVAVKRGQIALSIRSLAERWKWGVNKVQSFLTDTQNQGMIDTQKSNIINVITICNYDKYQTSRLDILNNADTQTDTQTNTQTDTQNEKKIETEKEKVSPHTPLLKEKEKEKEKINKEDSRNNNARTREEKFFEELSSAQIYIEQMAMRFHITTDYVTNTLHEFRQENELKDTPHNSLRDYKRHFHDWLRYQVEKKQNNNGNNNRLNQDITSGREQRARETAAQIKQLLNAGRQ